MTEWDCLRWESPLTSINLWNHCPWGRTDACLCTCVCWTLNPCTKPTGDIALWMALQMEPRALLLLSSRGTSELPFWPIYYLSPDSDFTWLSPFRVLSFDNAPFVHESAATRATVPVYRAFARDWQHQRCVCVCRGCKRGSNQCAPLWANERLLRYGHRWDRSRQTRLLATKRSTIHRRQTGVGNQFTGREAPCLSKPYQMAHCSFDEHSCSILGGLALVFVSKQTNTLT